MKASLIFSSTSHSINIQKVSFWELGCSLRAWQFNLCLDIQNRVIEVIRSEVYDTRNRAGRRATAPVPRGLGDVIPGAVGTGDRGLWLANDDMRYLDGYII